MKKLLALCLTVVLFIFSLTSCNTHNKEITCQEVIDIYEEAGYSVFHCEHNPGNPELMCYIKCTAPNSDDYIFFHFYKTNESAEAYISEGEWNILLYLYSAILGEPTWITTKTYNNIAIEYNQSYLYKPFKKLL